MNISGNSLQLSDQAGNITTASQGNVQMVALSSALTGSLTISRIITGNTPADWVIAPASNGIQTPPGTTKFAGSLNYALSNVGADAGKATIVYVNG